MEAANKSELNRDPSEVIANSPMSAPQIVVVAITIALNALDGFDVLSISFASPGIAQEWGIDRAALGIVLSMELVGMAIGSILLGGVADRIGRRPTILGCLAVMAAGMVMATKVRVGDQILEEMHVDGGPTRQVFVAPANLSLRTFDKLYPKPSKSY